jgi:hypothetical protein
MVNSHTIKVIKLNLLFVAVARGTYTLQIRSQTIRTGLAKKRKASERAGGGIMQTANFLLHSGLTTDNRGGEQ